MLNNIEAVIFDLDGTLVDSMWIWPAVDDLFLKKYSLVMPEDFHKTMEGMSYTETSVLFKETFHLPQTIQEIQKEWEIMTLKKYTEEVPLKRGVKEFLISMKQQGIKLGIATSNSKVLVDATLKARGVEHYFNSVRTACEVGAGKPAPDVYLKVAADLEVDPTKCLVFEDVPNGILAGKNAGMKVCAVADEFSKPQEEKKKKLAHYFIQDFDDLRKNTYEVL
ncbi:HAD family hydrolase [Lachnospiraceae bacterium LCP25S3_G4]